MTKLKNLPENSPFFRKPFGGINVDILRILAVISMLCDHTWSVVGPGNSWMNYFGRIAFPIFAFQISEGFIHTSDFKKYALRLFCFALLSEIPFDVFFASEVFCFEYQNTLFTLLLGLLALRVIKEMKKDPTPMKILGAGLLTAIIVIVAEILNTDYGAIGVVIVICFYLLRDFPFAWLFQFIALFVIFVFIFPGRPFLFRFNGNIYQMHTQIFALFSLVPIWLYNGKKGVKNKAFQYGFYAFYPIHLILLYIIRLLIS